MSVSAYSINGDEEEEAYERMDALLKQESAVANVRKHKQYNRA